MGPAARRYWGVPLPTEIFQFGRSLSNLSASVTVLARSNLLTDGYPPHLQGLSLRRRASPLRSHRNTAALKHSHTSRWEGAVRGGESVHLAPRGSETGLEGYPFPAG